MEIRIGGHTIKLYNEVNINLKYDCIADTFSFALYFDPTNTAHKSIFKPCTYQTCKIYHGGVLVMTGTVLSHNFGSAGNPPKQLVYISGYSVTGVLDDSCILRTDLNEANGGIVVSASSPTVTIPGSSLQFDGLTLEQIAGLVTGWYEFKVIVDAELKTDAQFTKPFPNIVAAETDVTKTKPTQSVGDFLDQLCKQKNVVLSHTKDGNVLITRHKSDKILTTTETIVNVSSTSFDDSLAGAPPSTAVSKKITSKNRKILFDFNNKGQWTKMSLNVDGQKLHRLIQVVGQHQDGTEDNALDSGIANPYVAQAVNRYVRIIQTSGDSNDTPDTARSILGDELKSIVLTIEIQGWTLGGNLVTPNQLVSVQNDELYLFNKNTWFIQEVALHGDEKEETAVLTCVLPYCFGDDEVKNIF